MPVSTYSAQWQLYRQQKALIKISLKDQKHRSKALRVVVGAEGIVSAGWKGSDENEIEVVGEGVDMVKLAMSIRKKVGYAEVVAITQVPGDVDKKPDSGGGDNKEPPSWAPPGYPYPLVPAVFVEPAHYPDPAPCSIM